MAEQTGDDPIYCPLREDQTRLMRVNHSESPFIECELGTFSLRDRPNYTALSYCWTKEEASFEIRLNGQPYRVRPNLYDCLQIVSEERHTCWIFIDALCINQEDVQERGQQVKLMRQIYRDAEEVIAWLNTRLDPEFIEEGQCNLERFYDALQAICDSGEAIFAVFGEEKRSTSTTPNVLLLLLAEVFFRTEYWSRVWIVQEIPLARVLTLRSSKLRIRSNEFQALATYILRYYEVTEVTKDLADPRTSLPRSIMLGKGDRTSTRFPNKSWLPNAILAAQLMDVRHTNDIDGQSVHSASLPNAVLIYSRQVCSEPFDMVFGLLGLTNSPLQPNYRMSRLELFLRVLIESVVEGARLPQLETTKKQDEIPSWTRELAVGVHLLFHLQLNVFNPVVALTINAALAKLQSSSRRC